jgi:hypothetical protein
MAVILRGNVPLRTYRYKQCEIAKEVYYDLQSSQLEVCNKHWWNLNVPNCEYEVNTHINSVPFALKKNTGCFKKSFTTLKDCVHLFRGHVQCFELL